MQTEYTNYINRSLEPMRGLTSQNIEYGERFAEMQMSAAQSHFEIGYNYMRTTLQFFGASNVQDFLQNQQDALLEMKERFAELVTVKTPSLEVPPEAPKNRVKPAPQKVA